jgi:hypothetical protein
LDHTKEGSMEGFIRCPQCGNAGREEDGWGAHAPIPFRIVERVVRSWDVVGARRLADKILLVVDLETDRVDWESGEGEELQCNACFAEFPLPEGVDLEFQEARARGYPPGVYQEEA